MTIPAHSIILKSIISKNHNIISYWFNLCWPCIPENKKMKIRWSFNFKIFCLRIIWKVCLFIVKIIWFVISLRMLVKWRILTCCFCIGRFKGFWIWIVFRVCFIRKSKMFCIYRMARRVSKYFVFSTFFYRVSWLVK